MLERGQNESQATRNETNPKREIYTSNFLLSWINFGHEVFKDLNKKVA